MAAERKADAPLPTSPRETALRLVLSGGTDRPLSPDQRTLILSALAQGMRGSGEKDAQGDEGVTPDRIRETALGLITLAGELGMDAPPLDRVYLRTVGPDDPEEAQAWALTVEKMELLQKRAEILATRHDGDPVKMKAREDLLARTEASLAEVERDLAKLGLVPGRLRKETPKERKVRLIERYTVLGSYAAVGRRKDLAESVCVRSFEDRRDSGTTQHEIQGSRPRGDAPGLFFACSVRKVRGKSSQLSALLQPALAQSPVNSSFWAFSFLQG